MKKRKKDPYEPELSENVRVLRCGKYGYIHKGKAIFKTDSLERCNDFSDWVSFCSVRHCHEIRNEAARRQSLEPETKELPKIFDAGKLHSDFRHNYEAVIKQKY